MEVEDIEKEIEKLPESNKCILPTEVMSDLCREILDEACRNQLRELFGIDCWEKLEKRLKTGV